MRLAVVLVAVPALALADPPAAVTLDATAVADAPCTAEVTCKTLATRTIAGKRVRVFGAYESMEDIAYVELGASTFSFTTMRYTKLMGERGEDVQTQRDWNKSPVIERGTLADGGGAAILRIPWSSYTYDKASDRRLSPVVAHAVIAVCAVGAPACSSRLDVDCPASGCTTKLTRGVLEVTAADGAHRLAVTP
jgi:hypothetical protein